MKKKGISLIVLVITIIVMIILAAAIIITLSSSGIIGKASEAVFKQNIKAFTEEYERYKITYVGLDDGKLSDLNADSETISGVITSIPENLAYRSSLKISGGVFTYAPDVTDATDVQRAKWACQIGMVVEGITKCEDIKQVETPVSTYKKVGNIYYNTPDLTGFNPEKTYYVTYDAAGNETVGENILNKAPANWYDYENKQWANVVTINGKNKAYMVWVPRYVYKVDSTNKKVDIRFITKANVYKDSLGVSTTYKDKTPAFDVNNNQTNYVINPAFTVDMSDKSTDNIELTGFWAGKYEVSESLLSAFSTVRSTNSIKISSITYTGITTFDYYINGTLKATSTNTTYTFDNLAKDTTYTIKIVGKDSKGEEFSEIQQQVTTLGDNTNGITGFAADAYGNKIQVYSTTLNTEASQNPTKTYEFYLNDTLITTNTTGKYVFENLTASTVYSATVKIKDSGTYYGTYTRTFTTPGTPAYNQPNAPDITGFNKSRTYYVTYDDAGNETRTLMEGNTAPSNWYNYSEKKWANIVAVDNTTGKEAYMVWIPRYEYRVTGAESSVATDKRIDMSFIPVSQVTSTTGYTISSVFTVDMTDKGGSVIHIPGFWAGKYEVSESN